MKGKYNLNLIRLVKLLNDGEFHDGTQLGDALQMTRSAVWKMIKKLEQYGVSIESLKGKGYRLREPLILLDPSVMPAKAGIHTFKKLDASFRWHDSYLFETINSTNTFLKSQRNKKEITFCLAEQQTQGKGRLGREWHSPFGKNMYISCLYPFQKDISELSGLSLAMSLAIVKTLQQFISDDGLGVKWPNDVLFNGQKLSGALIDLQAESHGLCQAIIGIGINVNMLVDEQNAISQAWTSLQKITGNYIDRNTLCVTLIKHLIEYLNRFNTKGFDDFYQEWHAADCLRNKTIVLNNVRGIASGINAQGHLILRLPEGNEKAFSSGDVSFSTKG